MKMNGSMTVERRIPFALREAVFAASDLYTMKRREGRIRLFWRRGRLRRVEVHGLTWEDRINLLEADAMDVAVTLQNAGFRVEALGDNHPRLPVWTWGTA